MQGTFEFFARGSCNVLFYLERIASLRPDMQNTSNQ